jgi:hypothetical protein
MAMVGPHPPPVSLGLAWRLAPYSPSLFAVFDEHMWMLAILLTRWFGGRVGGMGKMRECGIGVEEKRMRFG